MTLHRVCVCDRLIFVTKTPTEKKKTTRCQWKKKNHIKNNLYNPLDHFKVYSFSCPGPVTWVFSFLDI